MLCHEIVTIAIVITIIEITIPVHVHTHAHVHSFGAFVTNFVKNSNFRFSYYETRFLLFLASEGR